jgi:hypothetical protein
MLGNRISAQLIEKREKTALNEQFLKDFYD